MVNIGPIISSKDESFFIGSDYTGLVSFEDVKLQNPDFFNLDSSDMDFVLKQVRKIGSKCYLEPFLKLMGDFDEGAIRKATQTVLEYENLELGCVSPYLYKLKTKYFVDMPIIGDLMFCLKKPGQKFLLVDICNKNLEKLIEGRSHDFMIEAFTQAKEYEKKFSGLGLEYLRIVDELDDILDETGFRMAKLSISQAFNSNVDFARYFFRKLVHLSNDLVIASNETSGAGIVLNAVQSALPKKWKFVGAIMNILPKLVEERGPYGVERIFQKAKRNNLDDFLLSNGVNSVFLGRNLPYKNCKSLVSNSVFYPLKK